jgi:hypothetical protein
MLTPLGVLQAKNHWLLKLNQNDQSMLAIALPAEDNWKHKPQLSTAVAMNRAPHSSSSLTSPVNGRDGSHSHLSSTPMVAASSSNGTVVPSSAVAISNGAAYGSPSKPLVRSKSRGGSVGGFVHGLVNNVQASLRNVGHKTAQSGTPLFSRRIYLYFTKFPPTCFPHLPTVFLGMKLQDLLTDITQTILQPRNPGYSSPNPRRPPLRRLSPPKARHLQKNREINLLSKRLINS